MNKEESLALYAQGRDAWNAWAEAMLEKRRALEEAGEWVDSQDSDAWNEPTRDWHETATADFREHPFEDDTDFSDCVFPGDARFESATFSSHAWFENATFSDDVWFLRATFSGDAWFIRATFSGIAWFGSASFSGDAWFTSAAFSGDARFDSATFSGIAWFESAAFSGEARFDGAAFSGVAEFANTTFAGVAEFASTTFSPYAGFDGTKFSKHANFDNATFAGVAVFAGVAFSDDVAFDSVTFSGYAGFDGTTFSGNARFTLAKFEGFTSFAGARFESASHFDAIVADSAFSMADATFLAAPDFIQAHFEEPPRLDDLSIEPRGILEGIVASIGSCFQTTHDADHEARWRWLKKLAVAGHDHGREQEFFKRELLALRGRKGAWRRAAFWFGLAYQALSDFGRSLWLPLAWLGLSIGGFAALYLGQHRSVAGACEAGSSDAIRAALGLSLRNTLLFASAGLNDTMTQMHGCLWGWRPMTAGAARLAPAIPDAVAFLGVAQNLLSAVLIFLFLLALRNHFRIK